MDNILRGSPHEGKIPLVTVHEYMWEHLAKYGDDTFLINASRDQSFSGRYIIDASKQVASGLRFLGVGKSDIITCYGLNSTEYVLTLLGSMANGMSVNTLNPAATSYELRHYLKLVQPRVVFTELSLLSNIEAAIDVVNHKPIIVLKDTNGATSKNKFLSLEEVRQRGTGEEYHPPQIDVKEDVAYILFSSGTTGLPKGVKLTHYNCVSHSALRMELTEKRISCYISAFPMYHVAGLLGSLQQNAIEGHKYVFMERYELELCLLAIVKYKVTALALPPSVLIQLCKTPLLAKYDVSRVDLCASGGASVKPEMEELFKQRFNGVPIRNGYGLTESSGGVIYKTGSIEDQKHPGSSGKIGMGTNIKIVDPDTNDVLGPNQRGELQVQSPRVMKGYLHNEKATRESIDAAGWLHTGDLAYYDNDGYIYVVDRIKELIKYKGNQVAPAELEAVILDHPDVADVGVVGVEDPEAGQLPRAYVVRSGAAQLTEVQLNTFVADRVSHYKQLRGGVIFVNEIPRLASGKILRRKLRELDDTEKKPASKL